MSKSKFDADDPPVEELASMLGIEIAEEDSNPGRRGAQAPTEDWLPRLNPTQMRAFNDPSDVVALYGPKFSGKCRDPEALVYTADGLKRLRRLMPDGMTGELADINTPVVSWDGDKLVQSTATKFYVDPSRNGAEVVFSNGSHIKCSWHHPIWCATNRGGESKFGYLSVEEIARRVSAGEAVYTPLFGHPSYTASGLKSVSVFVKPDWCKVCGKPASSRGLCKSHYQNLFHHRKENHNLFEHEDVLITEGVSYLLGALCGDGSCNGIDGTNRGILFSNIDPECIEAVRAGASKLGCEMVPAPPNSFRFNRSKRLRSLLVQSKLDCLCYHKRIPDVIIESPRPVLAAFMRGLFDTDGTVCKNSTVGFTSVSEGLVDDVIRVLQAFGIVASKRFKKSASGRPTWNVLMCGRMAYKFGCEIGFLITRKQNRIIRTTPKKTNPHGFNRNAYGYPEFIKDKLVAARKRIIGQIERPRAWHREHKNLFSQVAIPIPEKLARICNLLDCHGDVSQFTVSNNWLLVKSVAPCETELMDVSVPGPQSFIADGLINHNTISAGHSIVRHLYEEWDALQLILGASYSALSEGICHDINNLILPTWRDGNRQPAYIYKNGILITNPQADELMDNGIGLEFTPWKLDPATKHMYCKVQNRFGGWSRIRAMSIPYAKMVEARIKGPAPSGVYLEEATDTDGKEYFTYPSLQLYRRRDIVGPQQYRLSCNPKKPSWVYDWLWNECVVESGGRVWPDDKEKPGIRRDEGVAVYFIPYEENKHNVNQKNREKLESELRTNPILKARLVDGLWVEMPDGEALFKDQFSVAKHIFGNADLQRGLAPTKGFPIVIGYDPGSVNTGITFGQCIETTDGPLWIIFDELCFYQKRVPGRRLARGIMEKMAYWQRRMEYRFEFRHIADDQATTQFNQSRGSTGARDLLDFSTEIIREDPKRFEGLSPIRIVGCPKPAGSIETRANIMMDALHTSMIAISANCKWVKSMMLNLPRAKDNLMEPANPHKYKHTFDALTYPMFYRRYIQTKGFVESGGGAAVSVSSN